MKKGERKRSVVTGIIALIIVLIVVESTLRVMLLPHYGIPPYTFIADEELDYIPNPGFEGFVYSKEHPEKKIMIKINSDGFRDKEYEREKPGGVLRIMTLGDSETFPDTLEVEEQYGKVMEMNLNKKEKNNWEVINLGVSGYGTKQAFAFFKRKGIHYDPDIVTYLFVPNDVTENSKHKYTIIGGSRVKYEWKEKKKRAALQVFIYRNSFIVREVYRIARYGGKDAESDRESEKLADENWQIMRETLREMREYFEEKNIRFIVIIDPLSKEGKEQEAEENKQIEENMVALLEELKIEYSNPAKEYLEKGGREVFRWKYDTHLNKEGHEFLAEIITDKIINRLS